MSAAHTPGPKTSGVLWLALVALGREGGNMTGGKYRTEWELVREAHERALRDEKQAPIAPKLAEALRALIDVSDVEGVPLEQRAIARDALAEWDAQ